MGTMIADAELLPDHLHHPRCSPDLPSKTEGFRSLRQQGRQLRHLFGIQLRLPAWRRLMPQGFYSLCLRFFEPLTHRPLADSECGGNIFVFPSLFMQLRGAHPSSFAPILGRFRFLAHTSFDRLFVFVLYFLRFRSIREDGVVDFLRTRSDAS